MKKQSSTFDSVIATIGSNKFFWIVMLVFGVQAIWTALSGRFPMAFDEEFHLGIIKLYSHHLSPFWQGQPVGGDVFGVVFRDPSYLYHYLMSFPYRFLTLFTDNLAVIVITLRLINIAMFAAGIVIYRKLLVTIKASQATINASTLIFVLIPVVTFLAAQINYDNLLFPIVAGAFLLTINFQQQLKTQKLFNIRLLGLLFLVCLIGSLVKFAFLPFFFAIIISLSVSIWKYSHKSNNLIASIKYSYHKTTKITLAILIIVLLLAGSLFMERYAVNTIRYHSPIPECTKVLNQNQCSSYGPWIRDHNFELQKTSTAHSPIKFGWEWLYGMWLRSFFAVGGPATNYETRGPFTVPAYAAIFFGAMSLIVFIWQARNIWHRYNRATLNLLGLATSLYVIILWLEEYKAYVKTGQPVAINGRYLIPIMLPVIVAGALSISLALKSRIKIKVGLFVIATLCLLYGGGFLPFVIKGNPSWYWQNSQAQNINYQLKTKLGPLILGYTKPNLFLR